ncbi:MAG: hypothetical protein H8E44_12115 [Planctomycetes bacterium]|nr:hypothetical protein [Planctomycetota bacterium]MBL7043562.1 hypothetical protein [Pirellulaceae bacterium]
MADGAYDLIFGILLPLVVVTLGVLLLWALPVWLGLRWAKRKGYSPLWMLFGLHPIGAWIAAAIMQYLPPKSRCPACERFIRNDFVVCPHCGRRTEEACEVTEFFD